jgi:hypothetical protein
MKALTLSCRLQAQIDAPIMWTTLLDRGHTRPKNIEPVKRRFISPNVTTSRGCTSPEARDTNKMIQKRLGHVNPLAIAAGQVRRSRILSGTTGTHMANGPPGQKGGLLIHDNARFDVQAVRRDGRPPLPCWIKVNITNSTHLTTPMNHVPILLH